MADTFQIPSLKSIPQDLVDNTIEMIATRLQEIEPDIDFSKQAAYRLLPYLHGLLLSGTTNELIATLKNQNLAGLQAGLVTDEQADQIVKAFGITRRPAVANTISVLLVLNSLSPFGFSTTDLLSIGSLSFTVAQSISVRTSSSTVSSANDYVLTQIGTGKWGVVLPMVAKATGSASNLAVGTTLSSSKAISGLVSATVVASSGIGAEQETNEQMASRVLAAISIKTWASRSSFETIARNDSTYSSLVAISVVGFGDAEQRRDQRGVLPVSHGGRTDLWCKFRPGLFSSNQTVTATLTAKTGAIGTWSFTLTGTTTPGLYRVGYVVATDDQSGATFSPDSEVTQLGVPVGVVIPRGTGERYVPDVRSSQEAAFSAYQNTIVIFTDTRYDVTSKSVGFTRSYKVFNYYEPLVETFQQLLGKLESSNPAGDVLVRTAIPCEVSVTIEVTAHQGKTIPTESEIQQAVVSFVNNTGFVGSISEPDITSAVSSLVGQNGTVVVRSLTGRLKRITGSYLTIIPDGGVLWAPELPEESCTAKTVGFYSDITKVSVVLL